MRSPRTASDRRVADESESRSERMSAWRPQENAVRSKRGSRVGSCPRHQASISSTSADIRDATSALRSTPSDGYA